MSWIPRMPYNRYLAAFLKFVSDVTDPYLNLFRRILPPVRLGRRRARPEPDRRHLRADHRRRDRGRPRSTSVSRGGAPAAIATAGLVVAIDQATKQLADRPTSTAASR